MENENHSFDEKNFFVDNDSELNYKEKPAMTPRAAEPLSKSKSQGRKAKTGMANPPDPATPYIVGGSDTATTTGKPRKGSLTGERTYYMRHLPVSLHETLEEIAFALRQTKEDVVIQALAIGVGVLKKQYKLQ